ncbi:hypothetical protein EV702DRAFT_1198644 [Suillus placidus]|uniref:Uncharacterized protein n=1 Tax=Suillus placidus TaxID=48579 RepID=A0A9P6ZTN5_9AGAM|nr:hypothetical protein EV702DRAFT_1198644 [Suillus placidus]
MKVKKAADKAPKAPPPSSSDDDESEGELPVVPPAPKSRKPTMQVEIVAPPPSRPFKFVAPPSHPFKVVPKPEPTPARSEVIEVTSAEENTIEEPDTEYEEGRGKKRKLKSTNTLRALKKPALSKDKTNASKVGKKGTQAKAHKAPPLLTSIASPTKGGPLSPLTVGSSSVVTSPAPEAVAPMRLHDGPSNGHTEAQRIKPRPITKESKGKMKRALRMAYTHSDESEVDEGKKVDVTITKSAVSPSLVDVPTETSQEDLTKELHDDRPAVDQQEPPQITNPIEDLPDATHNSRDPHEPPPEPPHHDPREGVQQDPPHNRELQHEVVPDRRYNNREVDPLQELHWEGIPDRHEGDPPWEPHREVIPDRCDNPHEGDPLRNSRKPRDTFRRDPRDPLPDPRQPLHGHSREPWYMQDPMCRDRELNNCDALHPRDAFYYRDTRNLRYTGLQAPDHYGPEPRTDSEFTGRDSSPASELHRDALYGHGERERTYPSRYSPVLGPDYGREGGYARHDDLDERRAFGGGAYRDSGYPQARARYHDSRWTDHVRNVDTASADYVLRAFNRESTNPPRPPQ